MENKNYIKKVTQCTIKEVQNLFNPAPCKSKAANMIGLCRDALAKEKHHILTLEEFIKYYDIIIP